MGYKLLASAKSSDHSGSPGYYMEFTNIDQDYDDLLIKGWFVSNHSVGQIQAILKLGTSVTGYSRGWYSYDGATMSRQSDGSQRITIYSYGSSGGSQWRDVFFESRIPRYSDTTYYKKAQTFSYNATGTNFGDIEGAATLQSNNTNAISEIQLQINNGYSISTDSQWWLYGIKNS